MPRVPIILAPSMNQRGSTPSTAGPALVDIDQRMINFYVEVINNAVVETKTPYLKKRPGLTSAYDGPGSGWVPVRLGFWDDTRDKGGNYGGSSPFPRPVTAYFDPTNFDSRLYVNATLIGTILGGSGKDALVRHIDLTEIGGIGILVISTGTHEVSSGNTAAYFYPWTTGFGSPPSNPVESSTFTGDTHSNTTVDNISSTTDFYIGQPVSGSGIPAGAYIAAIPGGTSITLSAAATATAAGVTITRTHLAKIVDADFPTGITGHFVFLDGRAYVATRDGRLYESDSNSLWAWGAANFESASALPDGMVGIERLGDELIAFGRRSIEHFYNAGDASGAVISVVRGATKNIGCDGEYAYCKVGDQIFFVSNSGGGLREAWVLEGRTVTPISRSRQNAIFNSGNAGWKVSSGVIDGKRLILFTEIYTIGSTNGVALAYYVESGTWGELTGVNEMLGVRGVGSLGDTYTINFEATYGFLQRVNRSSTISFKDAVSPSDAGSAFTATVVIDLGDMGAPDIKTATMVSFDADTESGTSVLNVSFSDNDQSSYQTARAVSLASLKKQIRRCGSFFRRTVKLTHANDTPARLRKMYVDLM